MRRSAAAGITAIWLLLSVAAFAQTSALAPTSPRRRNFWTELETGMLMMLHRSGSTTDEISTALGRSRGSVATKVSELQEAGVLEYRMRGVRRSPPPLR